MKYSLHSMSGIRCSYCQDGPYKENMVEPNGSIGRLIEGNWFCEWCAQYGVGEEKGQSELVYENQSNGSESLSSYDDS